ncbi:MAG: Glu/Leu/Phe/Val dehydrogenase dimerization domain-containing protein [Planctomycetota bacterium]
MSVHILDAMAREGFEEVVALHDRRSGLRGFLGIHDSVRGPAFGGIRRWTYRDEREALLDLLRLARAMTRKAALLDLPAGGGKIVLVERDGIDWPAAYRYLGSHLEGMGGRFFAGPDLATGPEELAEVARATRYVTDPSDAGPGELAESTAEGVFRGMAAALRALDGEESFERATVVVQGLGAVGMGVARRLAQRGARVLAADLESERVELAEREFGAVPLEAGHALGTPCDIFAPCALGGHLHDLTVQRLRCRAVVGAANNVLARPLVGDRLHARGVLYAPDFIVNSGALVRGSIFHLEGRREPVGAIGARIEAVLEAVLARAKEEDAPPARVAATLADDRIDAWRAL